MVAARALPVAASALVGRAAEVAATSDMLVGGSTRLVTLTGPPGVGKTRLALAVAASAATKFADGAAWVGLASIRDAAQVPGELALGLGIARAGTGPSVDTLAAELADRDLLIVVDNCEHVLDAAGLIGDLIDRLPRLRVLATSRQRLHLLAESECAVPPLPMPADADADAEDLARLAANPAVALVLARASGHVTLTRRTARPLVDICLRLDGLPLALELAAARLRVFTPSELAFRLEHRTAGLTGSVRDAPARHRNLPAAIAWSHDLLPDAERTAFRRLSMFAGEWTLDAAEAVAASPGVLAAVESLFDQNLIQRVPTEGPARFVMLASIRDFAAEQLAASGELEAVRDRHARYFARAAQAWEATLGTNEENTPWAEFDALRADLAAALDDAGPGEARAWLGAALAWYGHTRGSLAQADTVLDALREVDALPDGVSEDARAAALIAAGVIALGRFEFAGAEHDLRQAIALSAARGDGRRRAVATAFLGHVARGLGRTAEAAELYRAARTLCEQLGNVRGTAWAAYDLGLLAADEKQPADRAPAEPLLREALTYFEDLGYDWAVAQAARGLATALLDRGAVDEAGGLLGRSLILHERVGDRRGIAQCLEALAEVAALRGSPSVAARLIGASQTQRHLAGTTCTESEQHRLDALDAKVVAALGRVEADHEKHGGRTAARSSVLDLAGGVADPAAAEVPVTLTARQDEVAALVAAGNTNRQIGRALGISEKTAEIHVRNIMTRLDVRSRAGVAAWVAARGVRLDA